MNLTPLNLDVLEDLRGMNLGNAGRPISLELRLIHEDPEQPRKVFDDVSLLELISSVTDAGIRIPISVRAHPNRPGEFMIKYGARRCRAAKGAGLTHIPAWIEDQFGDYDQVIENMHRDNLTPMETALFIGEKVRAGIKPSEVAKRLGWSKGAVAKHMVLLEPLPEIEAVYASGRSQSPETLYELRNVLNRFPDATRAWLSTDTEVTRRSVDLFRTQMETVAGEASVDVSPVGETPTKKPKTPADPSKVKRPVLIVKIGRRKGYLLLTVRPSKENHVLVKWDDTGGIDELPAYQVRIVRLDDARRYEPVNRGLPATTDPASISLAKPKPPT